MTPAQVTLKNERELWFYLYQNDFMTTHKPEKGEL